MGLHYIQQYTAYCTNKSQGAMSAALAALPFDTDTMDLLGLSIVTDVVADVGSNQVTRTTEWLSSGTGPIPDGVNAAATIQPLADVLTGFYTQTWSEALSTPVTPEPIVVAP